MSAAPLRIDVVLVDTNQPVPDGPIVVVEPLYGCVAVAAALEAGWSSVEIAGVAEAAAPIPLVSFEQPPSGERCRVRSGALARALVDVDSMAGGPCLLGSVATARPLAARLGAQLADRAGVTFVAAPLSGDLDASPLASDSLWAAGVLIRILLEELDDRAVALGDAAGVAVTLAQGAEDPFAQLSAGGRWRTHLELGGHPDDLRVAGSVDSLGTIPIVTREGDDHDARHVARAWT